MSHPTFRFVKRKSLADFTSENMPNQILCSCLRANTRIPDETILDAFNEAYPICIEVLYDPSLHIARSESIPHFVASTSRTSLLSYCFVYFLLSFHEKADEIRPYLDNLKAALLSRMPDIFQPILKSATSTAPLLPGSVVFDVPLPEVMPEPASLNDDKQFIKIMSLINKAEKLPNHEATIVLNVLRSTIAEESGNWDVIIDLALKEVAQRPETPPFHSKYHIRDGQNTTVLKVMKPLFLLKVFEDEKGFVATNFDDFIYPVFEFFNTPLISTPSGLLSEAKKTNSFMDVYKKITEIAQAYYDKGNVLENTKGKPTIKDSSQGHNSLFSST